jgi:hypothetical protein
VCLRDAGPDLFVAAHFPFDAAGILAWRARRQTFLKDFVKSMAMKRFLVPRGE